MMHIFRHIPKALNRGSVVTIGNFDGVHIGHQKVLHRLRENAQRLNLPGVVVTFEPQPSERLLKINPPPFRLTSCREKAMQFQKLGIEHLMILRFSDSLSRWEPALFVQDILCRQLKVKKLILGDDFRFGRDRQGHGGLLQNFSQSFDFELEQIETISATAPIFPTVQRVSSSWIRELLIQGHLSEVRALLGRHYSIWTSLIKTHNPLMSLINLQRRPLPFLHGTYLISVDHNPSTVAYGLLNFDPSPETDLEHLPSQKVIRWFQSDKSIQEGYVELNFLRQFKDEIALKSSSEFQTLMEKGHL